MLHSPKPFWSLVCLSWPVSHWSYVAHYEWGDVACISPSLTSVLSRRFSLPTLFPSSSTTPVSFSRFRLGCLFLRSMAARERAYLFEIYETLLEVSVTLIPTLLFQIWNKSTLLCLSFEHKRKLLVSISSMSPNTSILSKVSKLSLDVPNNQIPYRSHSSAWMTVKEDVT